MAATKRRKDRDLPPSVPSPREVVRDLATIQTLAFRLVSVYHRSHSDVFETLMSTSLMTFSSRGVNAGDSVGSAALARAATRDACIAAAGSIKDAEAKLKAALTALGGDPPSTARHVTRVLSEGEIRQAQRRRDRS